MKVAKQIAEGMTYLHSATPPWVHRNLTSANILVLSFDTCFFFFSFSVDINMCIPEPFVSLRATAT
jgi:serine/threonine protein kinase